MTNGEKILTAFPNATTRIYKNKGFTYIVVEQDDKWIADFDMEWWNTEYKEPTTKNDLAHCQHTDEEIAKSFIEDVEAVKDQLPCGEQMDFPSTFDEFAKDYGFKDKDEVYTNGSELIPVFRVKQWLEHISTTKNDLAVDIISRANALDCVNWGYSFSDIYKKINELPSVTPQEPKTGHWINIDATHSKCDKCGAIFEIASANGKTNFCPNCGADMREDKK